MQFSLLSLETCFTLYPLVSLAQIDIYFGVLITVRFEYFVNLAKFWPWELSAVDENNPNFTMNLTSNCNNYDDRY